MKIVQRIDVSEQGNLDDHAIASVLTYLRDNFGNSAEPVDAFKVQKVRHASVIED